MSDLGRGLGTMDTPEEVRLELFDQAARGLQLHIADLLRVPPPTMMLKEMVESLAPGLEKLSANVDDLLRQEARNQASGQRERLIELGAPEPIVHRIVRLFELNGGIGIAAPAKKLGIAAIQLTEELGRASCRERV